MLVNKVKTEKEGMFLIIRSETDQFPGCLWFKGGEQSFPEKIGSLDCKTCGFAYCNLARAFLGEGG